MRLPTHSMRPGWCGPVLSLRYQLFLAGTTELHRDGKGFAPFYDLVTTVGHYTGGQFEVPGIGLRFKYDPGTIMGLCVKVLGRSVAEVDGDRFCVVQYFHRKVLEGIHSDFLRRRDISDWMRVQDFIDLVTPEVKLDH